MKRLTTHTVTVSNLKDGSGAVLTSADATVKVSVLGAAGETLFAENEMVYTGSGTWKYDVPATAFTVAGAPYDVQVRVYAAGTTYLLATARRVEADQWWQ